MSKFITRVREKSHLVLEKENYLLDNYSYLYGSKFIYHGDKITSGSSDNEITRHKYTSVPIFYLFENHLPV